MPIIHDAGNFVDDYAIDLVIGNHRSLLFGSQKEGAMKRLKIQLGILIVALAGMSAGYGLLRAAGQVAGDNVVVSQVTEDDLLAAGRNLLVQAEVKGDVTAAGADVTIAGAVTGYVMVAGSNVNVNGSVGNDLWAAGANVNINAPIADNAMLAGRVVKLLPGAVVKHNAKIAGGDVSVQGRVERNLKLAARDAQIASEIGGSVDARDYWEAVVIHPHGAGGLAARADGCGAIAGYSGRHSAGADPARPLRGGVSAVRGLCGVPDWRMVTRLVETPRVNAIPANGCGDGRGWRLYVAAVGRLACPVAGAVDRFWRDSVRPA